MVEARASWVHKGCCNFRLQGEDGPEAEGVGDFRITKEGGFRPWVLGVVLSRLALS